MLRGKPLSGKAHFPATHFNHASPNGGEYHTQMDLAAFALHRHVYMPGALPLRLELVLHAHRDCEVDIELGGLGPVVDAVVGHHRVVCDAKNPVRRAIQVNMASDV